MTHTVWLGLRMTHPDDWEPSRLDLDPQHGRCVLVDRYEQRMDVHWRPSKAAPDVRRIMEHHRKAHVQRDTQDLAGLPGWEGFIRKEGQRTLVQAGRWFDSVRRMVELVISWPQGHDRALERRILRGIEPDPAIEGRRLWQALGLSVAVGPGVPMKSYTAQPGKVEFIFQPRGGQLAAARLSLAGGWLKRPLPDWLARRATGHKLDRADECEINGHAGAERLVYGFAGAGAMLGRRRWRLERAWVCPTCDRLFVTTWVASAGQPKPMPDVRVGCCRPLSEPTEGE